MSAFAPLRVFVVDDDRDTTECLRLLIGHWGHQVHVANEAAIAIEAAEQVKPDLMLVDLGMPVVDGLTLARRIRDVPALATTSLIALTGYADPEHQQQALHAGFDEYLLKPPSADTLQALLDRIALRVVATRDRTALSLEAAAISTDQVAQVLRPFKETTGQPPPDDTLAAGNEVIFARLQKSGLSDLILLDSEGTAERVRRWLRDRGCRVGPVFEPSPGRAAFYSYSRRQARSLLATHPAIRLDS